MREVRQQGGRDDSARLLAVRHVDVLVIDDDADAREMLAALLCKRGYSVATAADGCQALELLRSIRPAVILVDLIMPVMDGATFREHQRHNRDWLEIPTIVMTGSKEEPMLDLAVEETLRKPVHVRDVLEIVRRHVDPID